MKVIKKDGTLEEYNEQKIINAVNKSAGRVPCTLSANDYGNICNKVFEEIESENFDNEEIPVKFIHSVVEHTLLDLYPDVGYQYQQYRNYKMDFVHMMDEVYEKSQRNNKAGLLQSSSKQFIKTYKYLYPNITWHIY